MDAVAFKIVSTLGDSFAFLLVALGMAIAFRVVRFPDLTVEGAFMLGAATTVVSVQQGADRVTALMFGASVGAIAGAVTALLHCVAKVPSVLAGILTWMSAYSIGLRILGSPNVPLPPSALLADPAAPFGSMTDSALRATEWTLAAVAVAVCATYTFLESSWGLRLRCVAGNTFLAKSLGLPRLVYVVGGIASANALAALGGGLFCLRAGYADVNMAGGVLVAALAAMYLGGVVLRGARTLALIGACLVGTVTYRALVAGALEIGLEPRDTRLLTSGLVVVALLFANLRSRVGSQRAVSEEPAVWG